MNVFNVSVVFLILFSTVISEEKWSYDEFKGNGPSMWYHANTDCNGQMQSPINIDTGDLIFDGELTAPALSNAFEQDVGNVTLFNDGHTVVALLDGMETSGAKLPGTFKADNVHFHWGTTKYIGSEHTIDVKRYPMEMHIVHLNTKYPEINECLKNSDGLAVLGFFFEEGDENPNYITLIRALKNISHGGNETKISGFILGDMLNNDLGSFYRYQGSLTTPPCAEVVTWTVFQKPIKLSAAQLNEFRSLHLEHYFYNNYRPVQRIYDRKVYASQEHLITRRHQTNDCINGSGINILSATLLFISITVNLVYFDS